MIAVRTVKRGLVRGLRDGSLKVHDSPRFQPSRSRDEPYPASLAASRIAYQVDMMPSENLDHTKNWVEIMDKVEGLSKSALRELERDFRTVLGDDNPVSLS